MAVFFNLTKDYFFDEYLRTVDKIPDILKAYRSKNNLTISEACTYAGVSKTAWISWEHKTKQVNRINFEKLKANRIIFH